MLWTSRATQGAVAAQPRYRNEAWLSEKPARAVAADGVARARRSWGPVQAPAAATRWLWSLSTDEMQVGLVRCNLLCESAPGCG
jgi:hypothetical protein